MIIQANGAKVNLSDPTNRSRSTLRRVYQTLDKLYPGETDLTFTFATLVAQGHDPEGINYPVPLASASEEELFSAYECFANDTNTAFTDALLTGIGKKDTDPNG